MKISILALLSATLATAAVLPRQINGLVTFNLAAGVASPEPVRSLGNVSWLGGGVQAIGGPLGWWEDRHTDLKAFIQYNTKEGIAFDSTKSSRTIYLRPAGADGLSEVELGAPGLEPDPSVIRETNFTINPTIVTPGEPHYWFGYLGEFYRAWSACRSEEGNGWRLYFGKLTGAPKDGCTENFSLEVLYTAGTPQCC